MVRINRVYTKGGDSGETSLIGGERVAKDHLRIDCYGTVDELNACMGLLRTSALEDPKLSELAAQVGGIQNLLFNLGAKLATPDEERRSASPAIEDRHIESLESDMDTMNEGLPELRSFVLPGGGQCSSYCHLARTVCRRAERLVVALARSESVDSQDLIYLNRLSDYLFVAGRYAAAQQGREEFLWEPEKS